MARGLQRYTCTIFLMRSIRQTGNMPKPTRLALVAVRCRCVVLRGVVWSVWSCGVVCVCVRVVWYVCCGLGVYVCVYVSVHVYICVHVDVNVCLEACAWVYVYVYMKFYVCGYVLCACTCRFRCRCIFLCGCICMCKCISVCVYNSVSSRSSPPPSLALFAWGQMINETAINVVSVLKEVCKGHSLVPTQMAILMDCETNFKPDHYNASLLNFSTIVYDRLSAETADTQADLHYSYRFLSHRYAIRITLQSQLQVLSSGETVRIQCYSYSCSCYLPGIRIVMVPASMVLLNSLSVPPLGATYWACAKHLRT